MHDNTPDEHIPLLKGVGFRHFNIEMSCFGDGLDDAAFFAQVEKTKRVLSETGTDGVLAHAVCGRLNRAPYEEIVKETVRHVRACDILGIPDLVVHPLYASEFHPRQMYEFNRQFYRDILAETKDSQTHLLIENFADTEVNGSCLCSGADMSDFLDYLGEDDRVGACWDTAHCSLSRAPRDDQYAGIKALGGRLRALHISDNFGMPNQHWHSFPFSGIINFDAVLCALAEIGYRGAFNYEASYIVREPWMPPKRRKEWTHPTDETFRPKLWAPPLSLKLKAEELLYETGKYMLEQYGLFEE